MSYQFLQNENISSIIFCITFIVFVIIMGIIIPKIRLYLDIRRQQEYDSYMQKADEASCNINVVLAFAGENKIEVIKAVREITHQSLRQVKKMVDFPLTTIKKCATLEEAEAIKRKLEMVGAIATIVDDNLKIIESEMPTNDNISDKLADEAGCNINVVLAFAGENKIAVLKEVKDITNLSLKESKDLVESAPTIIKKCATQEEAEAIKRQLEMAGAIAQIKEM